MMRNKLIAIVLTVAACAIASRAAAQTSDATAARGASVATPAGSQAVAPYGGEAFGPGDQVTWIPALRFTGGPQAAALVDGGAAWYVTTAVTGRHEVDTALPAGASLQSVWCQIRDFDATHDVGIEFQKTYLNTTTGETFLLNSLVANSTGNGGFATIGIIVPPGEGLIRYEEGNKHHNYLLAVTLRPTTHSFRGCALIWRRTVSPAPASATFGDIPVGHPLHRFVEALVAAGITGGCGGGNYCANDPITRGQMAVFLAAALGLHWPW